jgi:nucleotide-binding universal stress UspA family protein
VQEYLEEVAGRLRAAGQDVATATEAGLVAPSIARLARERDVAAIAMATHGRGGVARAVLGSVATGVLQLAGVPLLLTRPAASPAAEAPATPAGAAQPAGA